MGTLADGHLNFDTKIDTKGFTKGASNLENQLGSLKSTVFKLGSAIAAAFSVKAVVSFAKESEKLYNEQLIAETKLETIMRRRMNATEESIQSVKDYASALQQVGVIGDEVQLAGLQELATYVDNPDSLKKMNEALNDMLAQQYGLNATADNAVSISTMLGKVLDGQTSALSRYGYSFTEAQEQLLKYGTEEQRVATLTEVIGESVGGMNEALAQTSAGKMQQLSNTMGDVREQFGLAVSQIKQMFIPAMTYAVSLLGTLASYTQSIVASIADVFGIELDTGNTTAQLGSSAASAAESYDDMADAAEAAAKANERSLAGFDKVTKLSSDTDSGSGTSAAGGLTGAALGGTATVKVDANTSSAENKLGKLKTIFSQLVDPFVSAWRNKGQGVIDSIVNAFGGIKSLAVEVGSSFAEVWTNGSGQEAVEHILGIVSARLDTIGNLAGGLAEAWDSDNLGTDIIQNGADLLNIYLGHIENIADATAKWADSVDFKPILSSVRDLTEAFEPLADAVGDGLEDLWNEVLLPMASWTIEDLIPTFLETLADVIEGLASVWETAYPVIKEKLWDQFLKPIAKWSANAVVKSLETLGDVFKKLCGNMTEKDVSVLIDLAGAITAIYAAAKGAKALNNLSDALKKTGGSLSKAWTAANSDITKTAAEGGTTFATKFTSVVGAFFVGWEIGTMIRDAIGGDKIDAFLYSVFDAVVGAWNAIVSFFTQSIPSFFSNLGSSFISGFTEIWNGIKNIFAVVGSWFSERAADIRNAFSSIGQWFSNIFSSAVSGIKAVFSAIGSWFSARAADVRNAFSSIGSWFSNIFSSAWSGIKSAFSAVSSFFAAVWANIKKPFSSIAGWFRDKFTAAWTAVKNVFSAGGEIFSGIKDGILDGLKAVVNALITGINTVIATPFNGINTALKKIKDVSIVGYKPFDWIKTIDVPQIPKLATGTVVPANYGEFLSILGDNKREPEVVSPRSTIVDAVREALAGFGGGDGDINITVTLDGDVVYKNVVKKNRENTIRTGKNAMNT